MEKFSMIEIEKFIKPISSVMSTTFANYINKCTYTNRDKEEESYQPEIEVKCLDGSSIYFKIFENGEVGFRTTGMEK